MNKIVTISAVIIIISIAGFFVYKSSQSPPVSNNENVKISQSQDSQEPLAQAPKIEVSPGSYDFGTVIYGVVAKHDFIIKNIGNEPLEIQRLSTSCGCTEAKVAEEDKVIAPGQSIPMLVTFDPAVHEDDSNLGNLIRIVYIKTNDPDKPETEVTINAFVVKED